LDFPMRSAPCRRPWDLPVPVRGASMRVWGLRPRQVRRRLA
jgi:hypothetical protein